MESANCKLSKIPGRIMPVAEKDKHLKDLTTLTMVELLDLKARESALLQDKRMLNRLPDKGKRIQEVYDKIMVEFHRRTNIDDAAKAFSNMNIAEIGIKIVNDMEWEGKLNRNDSDPIEDVIDSDDEEIDPLKVIADRKMHEKSIVNLPAERTLIRKEDLEEIQKFNDDTDSGLSTSETNLSHSEDIKKDFESNKDMPVIESEIVSIDVSKVLPKIKPKLQEILNKPKVAEKSIDSSNSIINQHVKYLVEMTENHVKTKKEKFLPFKTTRTNVHAPEKEKERKLGKYWEVTAATPPLIQHDGVKMIPLLDSVRIQEEYLNKMKAIQEEQAALRLAKRIERAEKRKLEAPNEAILKTNPSFTNYRNPSHHIEGELELNEDEQVHDNLDETKSGGVTYQVYE